MGAMMVGCAGKKEPASTPPTTTSVATDESSTGSDGGPISAAAARIYLLGEERYTQGRFDEAVALWGHAMLQLPADPSADAVRHKLIARMGYGLLQAHGATGDPSYLVDGQAMCEQYIAKHEELFGDTDHAREERGEIYELLYEFDSRLDDPALSEPENDAEPTAEAPASTDASSEADPDPGAAAPATAPDEDYRIVKVRRFTWAEFSDPEVRRYLSERRFSGYSLLDYGNDPPVHGPRVLVRVGALPRTGTPGSGARARAAAREAGLAVVEAARPALARCYEAAMAREPVMAARVEVMLTVRTDGSVTMPRLEDGRVVDATGDVCAVEALRQARIEPPSHGEAVEISMPIHFFYQDATRTAELFRHERRPTGHAYDTTVNSRDLPPIDEFVLPTPRPPKPFRNRELPSLD